MSQNLILKNSWKVAAIVLFLLLLLLEVFFILNKPWAGDYWEHKSALKELSLHPFHPSHPIISAQLPHAFYSPYLVLQGIIAHYGNISINQLLNISILINLCLFLVAVYLFVQLFFTTVQNKWKPFTLLLLCILFFHGINPPGFSSFFHFNAFPLLLSYPSTFSFICSVFAGYLFQLLLSHQVSQLKKTVFVLSIILLLWVVLLTHPVTYLFAASLFVYVFLNMHLQNFSIKNKKLFPDFLSTSLLLTIPFAFAYWWSYYPFYSLISYVNPGNQFHADSRELYSSLYLKHYPFLIFLLLINKNIFQTIKKSLPILSAVFFLSVFFVYGLISGSFGFGRVISFISIYACIFLIHLILFNVQLQKQKFIFAAMLLLAAPFIYQSIKQNSMLAGTVHTDYINRVVLSGKPIAQEEMAHRAGFLEQYLPAGAIVMADKSINFFIPGTGARVIASHYPAYWITDNTERLRLISKFFSSATETERKAILKKYKVDYIVLTPQTGNLAGSLQPFVEEGFKISENGITLLKVRKTGQ